jgi:hypothetical protein
MAATKKTPATPEATIVRVKRETALFPIVGTTPLITHAWSEKAKQEMRDKQTGKAKPKKEAKDPEADFQASKYRLPDGREAFPAVAFKAAIVNAARLFEGITMTELRQTVYVHGEGPNLLVPIQGESYMREDMVRIGMGTADLRYRACYQGWRAQLMISWVPNVCTLEQMVALIEAAGLGGIGEWRPEKSKSGQYGMFEIDTEA